ncbi:hypothetical protein P153DRAFT_391849 [Dothidotthia symphoricarpi CBS 119687]|uniref:Uncharacterized protein n=1 Tax=Dothidotthia symphoricarpi CBS 119687 TaxID=1392245 RepID=A0A6A6ATG7_9PLEO|nr:uncharacterized protein P153DRAFT_391849 [Dothidotthia symphoricarpi CBS 119687]KAF2134513.1 hypothetical protein P153DRAFT_391849 [Dothidotthia symphoricarpi CBS 119687]
MCKKASCDSCRKSSPFHPASSSSPSIFPSKLHSSSNDLLDKTTWWGCGKHVPGVMQNIPSEQWCTCAPRVEREGNAYPPMGSLSSA